MKNCKYFRKSFVTFFQFISTRKQGLSPAARDCGIWSVLDSGISFLHFTVLIFAKSVVVLGASVTQCDVLT